MIALNGITVNSPICHMASLGLVRILQQDCNVDALLGWKEGHAVLKVDFSEEELLGILCDHMTDRNKAPEWNWRTSTKKITPEEYEEAVERFAENPRALQFLTAFATNTVINDRGFTANTRLDLTSGQQALLRDLKSIAAALVQRDVAESTFRSSLFGGAYEDQSSFGWDPVAVRRHALEAKAPMKSAAPGKKGLVWLAAEALPFHTVYPYNGWGETAGCQRLDRTTAYFWPIWEGYLDLAGITFMRLLRKESLESLQGVTGVWASAFGKSGQYGALLPGKRLY